MFATSLNQNGYHQCPLRGELNRSDTYEKNLLFLASQGVDLFKQDSTIRKALDCRTRISETELIELLIKKKVPLENSCNRTPFLHAAANGKTENLIHLAERGANVFNTDAFGRNVLHFAAGNCDIEAFKTVWSYIRTREDKRKAGYTETFIIF